MLHLRFFSDATFAFLANFVFEKDSKLSSLFLKFKRVTYAYQEQLHRSFYKTRSVENKANIYANDATTYVVRLLFGEVNSISQSFSDKQTKRESGESNWSTSDRTLF